MSLSSTHAERWSLAHRVAFRFACAYFVLYYFPSPLGHFEGAAWLDGAYDKLWHWIVPWVGEHILHLDAEITVFTNGSGDTTFDYVQVLCTVAVAVVATVVWSLVDTRRTHYAKYHEWLRVYLRYVLAATMISYGMVKVIQTQFPFPSTERLMDTYGESSPMGLLWRFMGYSRAYNAFTGGVEVLAGALLFFRRTTTLGALAAAAAMGNVVMLNFCYDVPVKLYSSHLVLTALFLMLPDLRRLTSFFLLNRPTQPAPPRTPFTSQWMERARLAAKVVFIGGTFLGMTMDALELQKKRDDEATKGPLFGVYEVEAFVRNGQEAPPLVTDASRWRTVIMGRFGAMTVKKMSDATGYFRTENDVANKTLTLSPRQGGEGSKKFVVTYSQPDPEHLVLEGAIEDAALIVRLRKIEPKFLLVERGFHWVNEFPFQR